HCLSNCTQKGHNHMKHVYRIGLATIAVCCLLVMAGCGPGGLRSEDLQVGTGTEAKKGDLVVVHYTGRLSNATKFDSSHDHGKPYTFTIGESDVIAGWHEGVPGM